MNHSNSGLAHGTKGSPQLTLENSEMETKSRENESIASHISKVIEINMEIYHIILIPPVNPSLMNIKIISEIINCSFVDAKKIIETAPCEIFRGSAIEVKIVKQKLEAHSFLFTIQPKLL